VKLPGPKAGACFRPETSASRPTWKIGGTYGLKHFWARLFHPPVEGKLIRGFEGLDVGDRVRVELIGTDVERGFIDFARAGGQGD
jgi:hypothetical protein